MSLKASKSAFTSSCQFIQKCSDLYLEKIIKKIPVIDHNKVWEEVCMQTHGFGEENAV